MLFGDCPDFPKISDIHQKRPFSDMGFDTPDYNDFDGIVNFVATVWTKDFTHITIPTKLKVRDLVNLDNINKYLINIQVNKVFEDVHPYKFLSRDYLAKNGWDFDSSKEEWSKGDKIIKDYGGINQPCFIYEGDEVFEVKEVEDEDE